MQLHPCPRRRTSSRRLPSREFIRWHQADTNLCYNPSMRHNKLSLFYHFVWTTWNRERWITPAIERRLHRHLQSEAEKLGCVVLAINGVEEHVHLLVEMPPTVCVSDWMHDVKGNSSNFVNQTLTPDSFFKWRGSYAAFTVSRWDLDIIALYIANQKQHHADRTEEAHLEPDYDEIAD